MTPNNVLRAMVWAVCTMLSLSAHAKLPVEPMRTDLEVSGDDSARPAQVYRDENNVYVLVKREQLGRISVFDARAELILRPQTASFNVPVAAAPFVLRVGEFSAVVALPPRLPKEQGVLIDARPKPVEPPRPSTLPAMSQTDSPQPQKSALMQPQPEVTAPASSEAVSAAVGAMASEPPRTESQQRPTSAIVDTPKVQSFAATDGHHADKASPLAQELPTAKPLAPISQGIGVDPDPSPIAVLRLSTTLSLAGARPSNMEGAGRIVRAATFRAKAGTRMSTALRQFAAEHEWSEVVWRATSDFLLENDVVFEGASFAQALQKALEPFALSAELYYGNRAILILEGQASK